MIRRLFVLFVAIVAVVGFSFAIGDSNVSEETVDFNDVVIEEPTPTPVPRRVHIEFETEPSATMREGDTLKIISTLYGFDGALSITYEWQVDRNDGRGFVTVEGETNSYIIVTVTRETVGYRYRLAVHSEW